MFDASVASINKSWHCQVNIALVGWVGRAQCLGVHSVRAGRSRSLMRMCTTTTISVALASPSSEGVHPRFKSPVAKPGSNLALSGRKRAHLTGLFSPGRIVRCKRDSARFATGAHHAGPPPLARSSLPRRPVTLTSTPLKAVVVAAPPFFLPLVFLPSLQ